MASKQFLSQSIKYVPQAGFTAVYNESGGIEASQDFVVRNSDLSSASQIATIFQRGVTWESVWPDVPVIYRKLTMRDFNPTDNGDGTSILKVNFTGYQFSAEGSSGSETTVPTTTLTGQLEDRPLSDHPKWEPLTSAQKFGLGLLISGQAVSSPDFTRVGAYNEETGIWNPWQDDSGDITLTGDAITFARIIAEGETTYRKGGWTYSYNTESETGFPATQLNSLGKIVASPPGSPIDPGAGWTWLLTAPNQTQNGPKRFTKVLDFQLIPNNAKNQFLYGS